MRKFVSTLLILLFVAGTAFAKKEKKVEVQADTEKTEIVKTG